MANLAIAGVCNLSCPYCFAGAYLATSRDQGAAFIDAAAFERRLDFLERSGIPEARLIGGEPTLHPAFPDLVAAARSRGLRITVFSHGLMPRRALDCLAELPADACTVLVNMNAGGAAGASPAEFDRRRTTLRRLGPRAIPGFTIYRPDFELAELLTVVLETGCRPAIRLGLAQPMLAGGNAYLHPKQYPAAGARIAAFARDAAAVGVTLQFDCGFVRCMFADEELEMLHATGSDFAPRCGPILDIDLAGMASHCFPLTGIVQVPVGEGDAAGRAARGAGPPDRTLPAGRHHPRCSGCGEKARGACTGGCLAATMRRFRGEPFRVALPATDLSSDRAAMIQGGAK